MAKTAVALRLAPDVLVRVDAYAAARRVSRQVVLETFVLSGLEDSGRGVVDLVESERPRVPIEDLPLIQQERVASQAEKRAVRTQHDFNLERQRKLNDAKYRGAS